MDLSQILKSSNMGVLQEQNTKSENLKYGSLCRLFHKLVFLVLWAFPQHVLLEFRLGTRIKPASPSRAVCQILKDLIQVVHSYII